MGFPTPRLAIWLFAGAIASVACSGETKPRSRDHRSAKDTNEKKLSSDQSATSRHEGGSQSSGTEDQTADKPAAVSGAFLVDCRWHESSVQRTDQSAAVSCRAEAEEDSGETNQAMNLLAGGTWSLVDKDGNELITPEIDTGATGTSRSAMIDLPLSVTPNATAVYRENGREGSSPFRDDLCFMDSEEFIQCTQSDRNFAECVLISSQNGGENSGEKTLAGSLGKGAGDFVEGIFGGGKLGEMAGDEVGKETTDWILEELDVCEE